MSPAGGHATVPVRPPRARTVEVRRLRSRIHRVCEELESMLDDDVRRGDDWRLQWGASWRRREFARAVWLRLERSHPALAEAARLVSVACEMDGRIGGYAKRQVKAAEDAIGRLLDARAAAREAARAARAATG